MRERSSGGCASPIGPSASTNDVVVFPSLARVSSVQPIPADAHLSLSGRTRVITQAVALAILSTVACLFSSLVVQLFREQERRCTREIRIILVAVKCVTISVIIEFLFRILGVVSKLDHSQPYRIDHEGTKIFLISR